MYDSFPQACARGCGVVIHTFEQARSHVCRIVDAKLWRATSLDTVGEITDHAQAVLLKAPVAPANEGNAFVVLKDRYNAVVEERDRLLNQVDRLENENRELRTLEVTRVICDECQLNEVSLTASKNPDSIKLVLETARTRGWSIAPQHVCPSCIEKRLKRLTGDPRW